MCNGVREEQCWLWWWWWWTLATADRATQSRLKTISILKIAQIVFRWRQLVAVVLLLLLLMALMVLRTSEALCLRPLGQNSGLSVVDKERREKKRKNKIATANQLMTFYDSVHSSIGQWCIKSIGLYWSASEEGVSVLCCRAIVHWMPSLHFWKLCQKKICNDDFLYKNNITNCSLLNLRVHSFTLKKRDGKTVLVSQLSFIVKFNCEFFFNINKLKHLHKRKNIAMMMMTKKVRLNEKMFWIKFNLTVLTKNKSDVVNKSKTSAA